MSTTLQRFHYHVGEDPDLAADQTSRSPGSFRDPVPDGLERGAPAISFTSDEAAARFYLDELLQRDGRPQVRATAGADRPERVPGLVVESEQDLRELGTHQVRFAQTHDDIPVFGARAVVELTAERELVSVNAQLDEVSGVDPVESLSRADALARVAGYAGVEVPPAAGVGGRLNFYLDDTGDWHLAWLFPELPAAPPGDSTPDGTTPDPRDGHGLGPRPVPARYTYLVDAHDGAILFHYSAIPTAAPAAAGVALPIPTNCTGIDENEAQQTFFGLLAAPPGTSCRLDDPLRQVRTYDMAFADIDTDPPLPAAPVSATTSDFGTNSRAAVSAHVNASRVQDFYRLVLQRDGIDDQGMTLISRVNVTAASMQAPPSLLNAFWYQRQMWYGQISRGGRLVSLSRYLDVIGHELTHGVVETTSNLVYATQSGALNESFADCAGVIINNWYTAPNRDDVDTWNWEIGAGLRSNGDPLRNFADPTLLGHPAHMDKFRRLPPGQLPNNSNDNGWVHINSNIHNKAVHNLLTLKPNGVRVFTVTDVAVLTYLGMARLTPLATFADARQSVLDVAQTYFGGDPAKPAKLQAIEQAYDLVGIS